MVDNRPLELQKLLHESIWPRWTKSGICYSAPTAQNEQDHNCPNGNSEVFNAPDIMSLANCTRTHRDVNSSNSLEGSENASKPGQDRGTIKVINLGRFPAIDQKLTLDETQYEKSAEINEKRTIKIHYQWKCKAKPGYSGERREGLGDSRV